MFHVVYMKLYHNVRLQQSEVIKSRESFNGHGHFFHKHTRTWSEACDWLKDEEDILKCNIHRCTQAYYQKTLVLCSSGTFRLLRQVYHSKENPFAMMLAQLKTSCTLYLYIYILEFFWTDILTWAMLHQSFPKVCCYNWATVLMKSDIS